MSSRALQVQIRTVLPCRVLVYNAPLQECDVSIENLTIVPDNTIPVLPEAERPLPPIRVNGIRVAFPTNGIGDYITFPIAPGITTGSLTVFDRSIDNWRKIGAPVDPGLDHTHQLQDAKFEPDFPVDLQTIEKATGGPDTVALVIAASALLKLGAKITADFVARASLVDAELASIAVTLATGSNAAGPVVFATPYVPTVPGVGSTKVAIPIP